MRSELRRFFTRPICHETQRQHQCRCKIGSSAACANLVEQNVAVPQHEEVTIDVDELSDLVEQVARRSTVIHSDGAREGVAAAAEGELDLRERFRFRLGRGAAERAGVAAEAAEAVEEREQQRDRHDGNTIRKKRYFTLRERA